LDEFICEESVLVLYIIYSLCHQQPGWIPAPQQARFLHYTY